MFIRLERPDGRPIWINAAFVVTVEPRRDGGSVVVPIGDGLDYDVKESPDEVLALLSGAPAPAVVPVPSKDALKTAASTEAPQAEEAAEEDSQPKKAADAKKTAAKKTTTRKRTTRKAAAPADKPTAPEKPATADATADAPADAAIVVENAEATLGFDESEIERLRRMAPKSIRKLRNTLSAQFTSGDVNQTIRALEMRGVLSVVRDHVEWK